jgi:hypothetical protein
MAKGSIKITPPNATRSAYMISNNLGYSQSSNIHIQTTEFELLNTILTQSNQPYWVFVWNVSTPYDIPLLVAMIRDATAKEAPNFNDFKVSYSLPEVDAIGFRIDICQRSITIVCD